MILDSTKQPVFGLNKRYFNIREIWEDYKCAIVPDQTIMFYTQAFLTPTNHIFLKGRYMPTGVINLFDDKKLKFHIQLYLFCKFFFLARKQLHKGIYLFAHDMWSGNYYHWMCEALPRFYKMHKRYPDAPIIMPESAKAVSFISESIALLNLKCIWIDNTISHQFEKLVTIQSVPPVANVHPVAQSELKAALLTRLPFSGGAGHERKIYISRSKAGARRIENEDEIIPLLKRKNYEIIWCETLSFKEQALLFSETTSVVALHGAGLTNIMFMKSGKVMEIRSKQWDVNPLCYWRLANVVGLNWSYHQADSFGETSNFNNVVINTSSFENDLEEFERL